MMRVVPAYKGPIRETKVPALVVIGIGVWTISSDRIPQARTMAAPPAILFACVRATALGSLLSRFGFLSRQAQMLRGDRLESRRAFSRRSRSDANVRSLLR